MPRPEREKPLNRRIVDCWERIARHKVRGEVSLYLEERVRLDKLLGQFVDETLEQYAEAKDL